MRALIILRDALLALALGWLGISVEPAIAPAPKACPVVKGVSPSSGACSVSRRPGFEFGDESRAACPGQD